MDIAHLIEVALIGMLGAVVGMVALIYSNLKERISKLETGTAEALEALRKSLRHEVREINAAQLRISSLVIDDRRKDMAEVRKIIEMTDAKT